MPRFELNEHAGSTGCHLCSQSSDLTFVGVREPTFRAQSDVTADHGPANTIHETPIGFVVEDSIRPGAGPALASALPGHGPAPGDDVRDLVAESWHDFRHRWFVDVLQICERCIAEMGQLVGFGDVTAAEAEAERQTARADRAEVEAGGLKRRITELEDALADGRRARVELEATVASLERRNGSGNGKTPRKPKTEVPA